MLPVNCREAALMERLRHIAERINRTLNVVGNSRALSPLVERHGQGKSLKQLYMMLLHILDNGSVRYSLFRYGADRAIARKGRENMQRIFRGDQFPERLKQHRKFFALLLRN